MAQRRIVIPLYGPLGLEFDPYPQIAERLGVRVAELTELPPPRRELPLQPPPEDPNRPEPKRATPPNWPAPRRRKDPYIAYFADPFLRGISPDVIEIENESFSPIEHHGLIVVIGAASYLPRETFEIVQERAEESGVVIPIYVRGLK
jgi:hypothetical protein